MPRETSPPKGWKPAYPVVGSGLVGMPEQSEEHPYGVCYQPEIFTSPGAKVTGTSTLSEHGAIEKNVYPSIGYHPFFAVKQEAVNWLRERKLLGQVLRYSHHKPPEDRGPEWMQLGRDNDGMWSPYHPRMTAGVVAIVTDETPVESVHTTPMALASGFDIYTFDQATPVKVIQPDPLLLAVLTDPVEYEEEEV